MAAVQHDLAVEAGATFTTSFQYVDAQGASIPLTGWTATFQARHKIADTATVISKTLVIDGTSTMRLTLTAAETSALVKGSFVYGLEVAAPGAEPTIRLAQGKLAVSPEVVR